MQDESSSNSTLPPYKPGDNPNKTNAKKRIGNRPRTKNQPRAKPEDISVKWVEPLIDVSPVPHVLETNFEEVPSGAISLNFELPYSISEPFCSMLQVVLERTNFTAPRIDYLVKKLRAQCFFKCCRQLYSAIGQVDKSALQPLKAVFYDTEPIPKHMASAISMIGNLDSKLGIIEIKHAVTLFRRWLSQGLAIDPDSDIDPTAIYYNNVWRTPQSKGVIDDLAREFLQNCHDKDTFTLVVKNNNVNCGVPVIPITDAGYGSISNLYPHAPEMRDCVAALQQTSADYARNASLPHGITFARVEKTLNISDVSKTLPDLTLKDQFERCALKYVTQARSHISAVFEVGEPPAGSTGFPAQLVTAEQNTAKFKLPLSDADKALGYMFNPMDKLEFHPKFVAYGRRIREDVSYEFAAKDAKHIASG